MPITEYNVLSYDFLEFLYLNEIISNCNSNNNRCIEMSYII